MKYNVILLVSLILPVVSLKYGMEKESNRSENVRKNAFIARTKAEEKRLNERYSDGKSLRSIFTLDPLHLDLQRENPDVKLICDHKELDCLATSSTSPFLHPIYVGIQQYITSINAAYNRMRLLRLDIIMENCPHLKHLDASHNEINYVETADFNESDRPFGWNRSLTSINLDHNKIQNHETLIEIVESCHSLTALDVQNNELTSFSLSTLEIALDYYFCLNMPKMKTNKEKSILENTIQYTYKNVPTLKIDFDAEPPVPTRNLILHFTPYS